MKPYLAAYNISRDVFAVVLGALLFGTSLDVFLLPGEVVLGGFTGVATLLNILFGLHAGALILILNVPFAVVNVKYYGFHFLFKSFIGIMSTSAACELLLFLPKIKNPPLCAVMGGFLMGAGCAVMFARGFTTGGTDLVAWLLRVKFGYLSMGTLIFISDAFVVAAAAIVMRSFTALLLSVVSIAVCSLTIDRTLRLIHYHRRRNELRSPYSL